MSVDVVTSEAPVLSEFELNYGNVDEVTRARAGSLAAHGLSDQQIADTLLLKLEQVQAARNSQEFKSKYAETADEQIQRQLELNEGWDAVEEKAITQVLQTMEYNRDPKYALFAAKTANAARRRSQDSRQQIAHVIDATEKTTNIINLTLNKTFITKVTQTESAAVLDIVPRKLDVPRKQIDLPTPSRVEEVLAPVKALGRKDKVLTELEEAFAISGVFNDDSRL